MVGYGPEETHFVIELTYNYGVTSYEKGNDFLGLTIRSKEAIERAKVQGWPLKEESGLHVLEAPGGYRFLLINEPQPTGKGLIYQLHDTVPFCSTDFYWLFSLLFFFILFQEMQLHTISDC
jgi:hypothetical protein